MEQFTGPLASPPAWLDPAAKCTGWIAPHDEVHTFYVHVVDVLIRLGVPILNAFEVAANVVSEVGWKLSFAYWNMGGIKATKGWAERYKARTGRPAPWWPAHGNVGTGDSQTVFYRGYQSLEDCLDEWLRTFVPKPGTVADGWLYKHCGELFWANDPKWFANMVADGYKGPVTANHPDGAIRDHVSLVHTVRTLWAQSKLHVGVDGNWGHGSKAAAHGFRAEHGLMQTPDDVLDETLLVALAHAA